MGWHFAVLDLRLGVADCRPLRRRQSSRERRGLSNRDEINLDQSFVNARIRMIEYEQQTLVGLPEGVSA